MPIYRYTLKKYFKSPSTWVILIISLGIVFVIGGVIPFGTLDVDSSAEDYARLSISLIAGMTSFLAIFTTIFSGFKSANMFKDEIEDGTFLIMISKPISRREIILYKWLSLQTIIFIYTFLVSMFFGLSIYIFDVGSSIKGIENFYGLKVLKDQAFKISSLIWLILFIMSLIFSSIAILLSTKLSVGTTIGMSIALGVIIPVTSLISIFTKKEENLALTKDWVENIRTFVGNEHFTENMKALASMTEEQQKEFFERYFKNVSAYTSEPSSLYKLGIKTNEKNLYKKLWYFDFSYQINTLSEFATDLVVPNQVKDLVRRSGGSVKAPGFGNYRVIPSKENVLTGVKQFEESIIEMWKVNEVVTINYFTAFLHFLGLPENQALINTDITPRLETAISTYYGGATQKTLNATLVNKLKIDFDSFKANFKEMNDKNWTTAKLIAFYNISYDLAGTLYKKAPENSIIKFFLRSYRDILWPLIIFETGRNRDLGFEVTQQEVAQDAAHKNKTVLQLIANGFGSGHYNYMVSAMKNGRNIMKTTTSSYTNKFSILYTYIAIAFGLLPLSYFMVRKQDFK